MELIQNQKYTQVNHILDLADYYDAFFFDIWGVVHEGVGLYEGVANSINKLIDLGKAVRFISNAPRLKSSTCKHLQNGGLKIEENMVYTSGELTRKMLQNPLVYFGHKIENIYHIGGDRNEEILSNLNLTVTDSPREADIILFTAYRDRDEDHSALIKIIEQAASYSAPAICANPDTEVLHDGHVRYCAGFFAKIYETLGGKMRYIGKPDKEIFLDCMSGLKIENPKCLMIGDTFATDIQGANQISMDSGLVLTGNANTLIKKSGIKNKLEAINKICSTQNFLPTHLVQLT